MAQVITISSNDDFFSKSFDLTRTVLIESTRRNYNDEWLFGT